MNVFIFFRGKSCRRVMAALAAWCVLAPLPLSALPQGGAVRSGRVSWQSADGMMTVSQLSNRAIINWDTFGIAGGETVQFAQPGADASILNRVTGRYSSEIFGTLLANGNVYLINPNGILFGAGSRVDVGGLVASTFDLSDRDFNAGRLNFTRAGNAAGVRNHGNINAASFAYLIGANVENHGSITAPAVALAAGREKIVIDRTDAGGEIRLTIDPDMAPVSFDGDPSAMANVVNAGLVDASGANGGNVLLQGANVAQTGVIRADGVESDGGNIRLLGERLVALGGESVTTANAGLNGEGGRIELIAENYLGVYEGAEIAARGGNASGNGGFVETSGHESFIIESAPDVGAPNGQGGEWLIDPRDITIVNAGDDGWAWDNNDMLAVFDNARITVAKIREGLATGDVTIRTGTTGTQDGDITVAADIGYTDRPGAALTLEAARDINLDASVQAGADNTLGLTAGRDVNQNSGNVQVGAVVLDVVGNVDMTAANNQIGALSGTVGGDLDLENNAALDLAGLSVADGTATLNINGSLTGSGANTLANLTVAAAGDILLDNPANDLGLVTANANNGAGNITLRDAAGALGDDGIILRDMDGGTLTVTTDGSITQTSGTRVRIGGASDLTAAGQITLFNRRNDFGGPVSARAEGIQLRDRNAIVLDKITAGADGLTVRTDRGAITQLDGSPAISVLGETFLTARNGWRPADILLGNAFNNFVGAVHADGRNVALADTDDILLGRVNARGTLDVTAWGGGITQNSGGVRARGEATLLATGDIILNNPINDFIDGPVNADGLNIELTDANNILLGLVNARGTLDVTALDGDITQNDDGIEAAGETTFTALGNDIVLDSANNDFKGTVNAFGQNIFLTDGADGIAIGLVNAGSGAAADLVVINALNGGITDAQQEEVGHDADGFATMDDPRVVNITAQNVLLLADGDIGGAGKPLDIDADTLAARSGGSVLLYASGDTAIGAVDGVSGVTARDNAKIETLGGTLTVNRRVLAGGDVLLAANGGDVALNNAAAAGGNLTVLATGGVSQNSALAAWRDVDVEAGGSIVMDNYAFTLARGNVLLLATEDVALTSVAAVNARVDAGGDIAKASNNANILAQTAQLVAGGSIGGAGGSQSDDNALALETRVTTLAVDPGVNADIPNTGELPVGAGG
ncbi:MAG: filamentous hemagglutinin N-terminal domain-containing protein, partial [Kiritimatiellaeota bacterium]|nr:filamentous hemagglutinin N-terminal domain-containing protein [Kiritimatiellota bacterium]